MKKMNFVNENVMKNMLKMLEEVRKKVVNSEDSEDNADSENDSFSELLKQAHEIKSKVNVFNKETEIIELKKDDFMQLLTEMIQLYRLQLKSQEKLKNKHKEEIKKYLKEIALIDKQKKLNEQTRAELKYKENRLEQAKNEINAYIQNRADRHFQEFVKINFDKLKERDEELNAECEKLNAKISLEERENSKYIDEIINRYVDDDLEL